MADPCKTDPIEWLFGEGLLPLLGASALYVIVRCGAWITADTKKNFHFYLEEALDPMGWLYGGAILAMQTGIRTVNHPYLKAAFFFEGAICLLLLVLAMMNRAENKSKGTTYVPPLSTEWAAGVLVGAILYSGFRAYH
jgi:uncharacterized membrane protein